MPVVRRWLVESDDDVSDDVIRLNFDVTKALRVRSSRSELKVRDGTTSTSDLLLYFSSSDGDDDDDDQYSQKLYHRRKGVMSAVSSGNKVLIELQSSARENSADVQIVLEFFSGERLFC